MSQSLDQLSLEELRSQLAEIQFKIEEKEKHEILGAIQEILSSRELPFLRALLHRLSTDADNFSPESPPVAPHSPSPRPNKKAIKSGAYLRNGKVYLGIQEIKYLKYDKNNVLRISKEGKGLPPRVDVFPDEIREVLLTLPLRTEAAERAEDVPQEESSSPESLPETAPLPAPDEPRSVEEPPPVPAAEEAVVSLDPEPVPLASPSPLPFRAEPTAPIEAPSTPAPPPRRSRKKDEPNSPSETTAEKPPRPAPPEPLQVSLF